MCMLYFGCAFVFVKIGGEFWGQAAFSSPTSANEDVLTNRGGQSEEAKNGMGCPPGGRDCDVDYYMAGATDSMTMPLGQQIYLGKFA